MASLWLDGDEKLDQEDMIERVRIARERSLIDQLVLVSNIHIEVLVKRLVEAEEDSVLVESSLRPFARGHPDGINVGKNLVIEHHPNVRCDGQGVHESKHLAKPDGGAVRMFDPPFLEARAAEKLDVSELGRIVHLLIDSVFIEERGIGSFVGLIEVANPGIALPDRNVIGQFISDGRTEKQLIDIRDIVSNAGVDLHVGEKPVGKIHRQIHGSPQTEIRFCIGP